ncbi:DNA alkylation repair protein [Pelotomaculum isophthalicicum JI]|uniref:DNA alkylation repair protein n=1 Tax=Pelotomaculum isophthalicicum JI TaxID=947010 RepID=A0A9X4H4F8_9FIRM|nr:DNA alkylation repair protein [Pelotomaculum isophthalicicum]MDF9408718.1 DNA alkylation repair protein [Pelotomaculum isophthalicicum JI]
MGDVVSIIRKELEQNIDEKTKNNSQRFFKEEVKVYGVKSSIVGKIAKKHFDEIKHKDKEEIFSLCEQLLETGYCEDAFIAFDWSYRIHKNYMPDDIEMFERWIEKYVDNWAKCDTLCNHSIGSFIEQFPQYIKNLKSWARADNRWLKRASAVTLILPARKGDFLRDIFEISDSLLKDKDDLVQKGYGWMLKEASKVHQNEVFNYVMKNKKDMPRTALRYSIEKMPKDLKEQAMKK